ncbi:Hypothetical predicted protein [Mytilus galloprovincialis]|uniref:Uncharacterized protein n=1 Tax=Mytilus galloprovincialis TaxID=29158 RepID=A0A8B6GAX2_MYTGA|nr:Hypothetical predicted protein [Mytilus galloprovincialis]
MEYMDLRTASKVKITRQNSYINDTFQDFKENIEKHHEVLSMRCREEIKSTVTQESSNTRLHSEDQRRAIDSKLTESEQRVCQTVIQSQGRLEDKLIKEQNKTRNHTVELKADLMEENRILKDEVMDVKTELKELKTILIGYIGKQKVDLVINSDQIGKSTESPDTRKVGFTAKVNQTHVTADEENEIIEKLPPEVEIQTSNEGLPDAAVTETIEITGKKVNSIILELKATPGILHSVETFKAAILSLVQVIQKAGGIDADIEDTVTVNLKFESPLTEDQFAVVKCLFAKEWNTDNDTTQLPETSEVFELETTKPLAKTFCQSCHNKDKRIKALEEQNEKHEIVIKRNILDLQAEKRKLEDLQAKHKGLLIRTRPDDTGMISMSEKFGTIQKELKSSNLSSFGLEHTYDSSSKKSLNECRHCYEMEVIIIQLDRRLCEIRRRIIEAERQSPYSVYVDKVFEDILQITDQNTSMTSIEEKGRMKDKELRRDRRDRSSQDSKLISGNYELNTMYYIVKMLRLIRFEFVDVCD